MFIQFITVCTTSGAIAALPVGQIESMLEIIDDFDDASTQIILLNGKTYNVTDKIEEILAKIDGSDDEDDEDDWDDGFEDED